MKEALIVGAGLSGRGMLGEMYNSDNFDITFADINYELIEGLKKQGYYTVKMTDIKTGVFKKSTVSHFHTLDVLRDHDKYIQKLATTKYVSSALMPEDFELFAKNIAEAIEYRNKHSINNKIYITLGANYVGLRQLVITLIRKYLKDNEYDCEKQNVFLIMSIVNRKNLMPEEKEKTSDKYQVVGDNKSVLRVDNNKSLSEEKDLPNFFVLENNLDAAMAVKIWTGNVVQCSMAFVALSKGMQFTDEAANDEQASKYAYYASKEAFAGVQKEYNLTPRTDEETKYTVNIFKSKDFRDSLFRITREPLRKFKHNDRFIGPALCALKHGILPFYITKCLAYGFIYKNEDEPDTLKIQKKIKNEGIDNAITEFCELNLNDEKEKLVHDLILNNYLELVKCDL